MSTNNFFIDIYKDIFSLNSLYEIVRNIVTVMVIGIALYIFLEIYPITSEYLLFFLLALVGVLFYFCFPAVSMIPMLIIEVITSFNLSRWRAAKRMRHKVSALRIGSNGGHAEREILQIGSTSKLLEAELDEIKGKFIFITSRIIAAGFEGRVVKYIEKRLKENYPEKEVATLANSFRIVLDIRNNYCNTDTKAKVVNKVFDLLKMHFTEKVLLNEIEEIQKRINTELREDEKLGKKHVKEIKKFCERFIELWILWFLR